MSALKLYEIAGSYMNALEMLVDPETGEVSEDGMKALDSIKGELQEKGEAVSSFMCSLKAEAVAIDLEIRRLQARKKSAESRWEWLRGYLMRNMEQCGISKISCPRFSISLRESAGKVGIDDESMVPDEYIKRVETVSFDRAKMLADMRAGKAVPGAHLEKGTTLTIR